MNGPLNSAAFAVAALVVVASFALWIRALVRLTAGKPLLPPETSLAAPWGMLDVFMALLLQGVVIAAVSALMRRQLGIDLSQVSDSGDMDLGQRTWLVVASALVSFASCLLTVAWLWVRHRPSAHEFGFDGRRLAADIVSGGAAFIMLAPIVYGIQRLLVELVPSKHPILELLQKDPSPRFFAIAGLAVVVVAPVAEEFLYRLLFQGWLERAAGTVNPLILFFGGRTSPRVDAPESAHGKVESAADKAEPVSPPRWPLVVSALVFALVHAQHGPDPIPLFVFGLGLGYVYRQTHRITPCVVIHALLNSSTLFMMWLASQPAAQP